MAGRLNTLPALGKSNGCFSIRLCKMVLRVSVSCVKSPLVSLNPADSTMYFSMPSTWRYAYCKSCLSSVAGRPCLSMTSKYSSVSKVSCPNAPAFIYTAPPTLPGMPDSFSIPASPARQATSHTLSNAAPAWALIDSPSAEIVCMRLVEQTMPNMPFEPTKMLEPKPIMCSGILYVAANLSTKLHSSGVAG